MSGTTCCPDEVQPVQAARRAPQTPSDGRNEEWTAMNSDQGPDGAAAIFLKNIPLRFSFVIDEVQVALTARTSTAGLQPAVSVSADRTSGTYADRELASSIGEELGHHPVMAQPQRWRSPSPIASSSRLPAAVAPVVPAGPAQD